MNIFANETEMYGIDKLNVSNGKNILSIKKTNQYNDFECTIQNENGEIHKKILFFKFAPIIDYIKYLSGYCKNIDEVEAKNKPINNVAYIDGLFSFLSSSIVNKDKNFIHSVEWYSSFIGIKKEFIINIVDDFYYLNDVPFFNKKNGILFKLINSPFENPKLNLGEVIQCDDDADDFGDLQSFSSSSNSSLSFRGLESLNEDELNINNNNNTLYNLSNSNSSASSRSCSSRSSNTTQSNSCDSENESCSGSGSCSGSDSCSDSCSGSDSGSGSGYEEDINVAIYNFPVNVIAMEKCQGGTLDKLICENVLSEEEWKSCLFQITATLLKYNKEFKFTHNDLHANNVMICPTEIEYLWYNINNKIYKVPTFKRIFKIIDFGRSIFELDGIRYCSESFMEGCDACGQYNTEPYFNELKPRIEPNYSFDLTRLACSLIDCINIQRKCPRLAEEIINEWCLDDKGRNVLYKKSGEERYPEFKLYKMIARQCHNNSPEIQIKNKFFNSFMYLKKINQNNNSSIMKI